MTSWDPPSAIDERKSVWKRAGIPFPPSPPLVFGTTWYWGMKNWKAMAWLGPRRFGLYSLTTLTECIILYMASRVQRWSWPTPDLIGFYAKKARTIHDMFPLPPVLHRPQWAMCTSTTEENAPMQFGGDKGQICWFSKKWVVKVLLDYNNPPSYVNVSYWTRLGKAQTLTTGMRLWANICQ